jgi:hypothetical protein
LNGYLSRHFNAVRAFSLTGPLHEVAPQVPSRGLVVYSNHPSWWDPILFYVVGGQVFPGHAGFGPMDAEQLERYRFFKRLGVFAVEPGTRRGALTFLRASEQVLVQEGALLWVTAQGDFVDVRQRPVRLQAGLDHLARRLPAVCGGLTFLPCAVELVHWTERLPEALLCFGEPIEVASSSNLHAGSDGAGVDWTPRFEQRLCEAQDALAHASGTRDPQEFTTLLSGSRGVGGSYDLWRRLRARLRGERFHSAHLDRA